MGHTTLVFDLDGTLVDTAPDLAAATNHVMAALGLAPVDALEIRPYVGHGALVMIERAAATHGRKLSARELHTMFELFLAHYAANIAATSRPYPGAVAALGRARTAGSRLAVCTNKIERHARRLLDALGLLDRFAAVLGRDSTDAFKPDPRHLTVAIERAGGSVDRAVMIGDSETDIRTAKAAGVPVVAVSFGYSVEPVASFSPDAVIDHFDDLDAAIERVST
jgi:phosphoglycolate phosphatase